MLYNDIKIAINNKEINKVAEGLYQSYKESKKISPQTSTIIAILSAGVSQSISYFVPLSFSACIIIGLAGAAISLVAIKIFENLQTRSITPKKIENLLSQFYINQTGLIAEQERKLIQLNTQLNNLNYDIEKIEQNIEKNRKIEEKYEGLKLWQDAYTLLLQKRHLDNCQNNQTWIKCREIIIDELTQEPHASLINLLESFETHFHDQPELSLQSFSDNDSYNLSRPNAIMAYLDSTDQTTYLAHKAKSNKNRSEKIIVGLSDFLKINVRDCEFSNEQLQLILQNIPLDCPLSTASESYKNNYISQELSLDSIADRLRNLSTVRIEAVRSELKTQKDLIKNMLLEIEKTQKAIESAENSLDKLKNESFVLPF